MKKNQGITLIALIITIIVMLILVAVTITIAVNGGLFNYAREAGVKTNEAKDLEQNYVDLADDLSYEDLIGVYSAELNPKGIIPTGGKYTVASTGDELEEGDKFPTTVNTGDMYEYGDYAYIYNQWCDQGYWDEDWEVDEDQNGWGVRVKNLSKTEYEPILYSINDKPVNTLSSTFGECYNMIVSPTIPSCALSMYNAFFACRSLKNAPKLPKNVTNMIWAFNGCESLTGTIEINANPSEFEACFSGCAQDVAHSITLTGSASSETFAALKATGYNEGQYITIPE